MKRRDFMNAQPATQERHGGCLCGAVRFATIGPPNRVGICHCLNCRKRHGSPINVFAVFDTDKIVLQGNLLPRPSPAGSRLACDACGVDICWMDESGSETEIHVGAMDEIGIWVPQYELWTKRREPWMRPLAVPQYEEDRPADGAMGPQRLVE
jgi:hypothetical protein